MELGTIHHMAINVSDYGKAKEFYVEKLGFQILGEYVFPSGTRRMDCLLGDSRLEIFHTAKAEPRPQGTLEGYRHLAFLVTNIHKTVEKLEARGIQTDGIRPDPTAGGLMTFFRDPDGLELELHE